MILLDTHILLWWQNEPEKLPDAIRSLLDTTTDQIAISIITSWEISMLVKKGRVKLPTAYNEWMRTVIAQSNIEVLGLSSEIIETVHSLPDTFHGDPADQMIVSTAISNNCSLVTMDAKILEHKLTKTL